MYVHPSHLRAANTRRVFKALLAGGPCSRAALARSTGLSAATAGKVVDELTSDGLVEEAEGPRGDAEVGTVAMGRPPRIVRISARLDLPLIELGVRSTRIAAQPLDGSAPARIVEFSTPRSARSLLAEIAAGRRRIEPCHSELVLVSVPGVLDSDAQTVLCSPNLRQAEGATLLRGIAELWKRPICAVQEIQALAIGHQAAGAPESFVLVDFGDGVGGAVVAGGQLLQGGVPLSGEIGHTGVHGNPRRCSCGAVGCVETLVSRRGLLRTFRARPAAARADWEWLVCHVASAGVEPWLARAIDAASVVIAGAINLIGSQHVVLTGDLPELHPDIVGEFEHRIRQHSLIGRFGRLTCQHAPRRRALGLVAAAADRFLLEKPAMPAAGRVPVKESTR